MKLSQLDEVAKQHGVNQGKEGFLRLETGDNKVRIVSEYEVLAKHWIGGKPTICIGKEAGCVHCGAGDKPGLKFLMWVIDRADGQFKIAEVGWTVISALRDLQQDSEYGFEELSTIPYDVNIKKTLKGDGKQPSDTEYNVIAARSNSELTAEEKTAMAELDAMEKIVGNMKSKVAGDMGLTTSEMAPAPQEQEDVPPPTDEDVPDFLKPEQG